MNQFLLLAFEPSSIPDKNKESEMNNNNNYATIDTNCHETSRTKQVMLAGVNLFRKFTNNLNNNNNQSSSSSAKNNSENDNKHKSKSESNLNQGAKRRGGGGGSRAAASGAAGGGGGAAAKSKLELKAERDKKLEQELDRLNGKIVSIQTQTLFFVL